MITFCYVTIYIRTHLFIAANSFSKTDKELCQLTRQFEDFVVQFLDRCFAQVENCSLEQVTGLDWTVSNNHKNTHKTLMGTSVSGTIEGTLTQCSLQLFHVSNNIVNRKILWKVSFVDLYFSSMFVLIVRRLL